MIGFYNTVFPPRNNNNNNKTYRENVSQPRFSIWISRSRNGGPGGERRRARPVGVPGGQTDVLLAVRHGGELSGFVRVPAPARGDRLAPDHQETVEVHRENHQRRHRPVPAGHTQTLVAVPPVSHVRMFVIVARVNTCAT